MVAGRGRRSAGVPEEVAAGVQLTTVDDPRIRRRSHEFGLDGRTLYLPQMPYGGSYLLAAAIRSIGFDAWPRPTPTSARSTSAAA